MSTIIPSVSGVEGSGQVPKQGSSWVSAKTSERTIALQTYASDPKYKKYVQQVERCLNSFDDVKEWADFIKFLKQLLKTFQSYMQFKEIPRKLIVAKRLAQCLNPALPTGVHQLTLEVYVHILAVSGAESLKRDLSLWSSGLFPFFEYAATSVKPTLLNIYDTYYLPLQGGLRPIMKSFILSLLPGLEEETGEFFEKVLNLLDRISGAVSPSFFFQNIWLTMLTTPSARGTSLNFLARRLPRLNANEDITDIVGKDIGLMIRAFAAALEDENLLVRRAVLDILLQNMRMDSHTIRKAQNEDRIILMRAATGVVLRRDLSLNRRLYTWLLGPDENSDSQISYLKEHGLKLLSSTLKNEMISPSGEYAESRPFKIFISLLDKWEIGGILTETLVYDSFKAIMDLVEHPTEHGEDLSMTANTLYDAVEPQILWRHVLVSVFDEISGDGNRTEAIHLVHFMLRSFSQDEEIQTIHLPVVFASLVDLIESQTTQNPSKSSHECIRAALHLLEVMLEQIPRTSLLQRPETTLDSDDNHHTPFRFACLFFKITDRLLPISSASSISVVPYASCMRSLMTMCTVYTEHLKNSQQTEILRESFSRILTLINTLVGRLTEPISLAWIPTEWMETLLSNLENKTSTFAIVDRIVSLAITLQQSHYLEPKLVFSNRSTMYKMITTLLRYLYPDFAGYHVRAVSLIWSLHSSTARSHVESIVAQYMTTPTSGTVSEAYEAFGVIWRLTEDNLLPGFHFRAPLMIILDTLKSDNSNLRRVGETWMRCSLKSYIRVLDPILHDLLDPSILRTATTFKVRGREIPGFLYERSYDQRFVNYLLETLLSIVSFGGQGFSKAARTSSIKRSHHAGLVQRVFNSHLVDSDATYLDVLIELLLRFIQSEFSHSAPSPMHSLNNAIQSNSIELLQVLVSRGEVESISVENIEAAAIGKLYFSIHTNRLDLQNKWLHLLHSVISVSTAQIESSQRTTATKPDDSPLESGNVLSRASEGPIRYPLNPLMVQTLVDGISVRSNRPVLQHWLDFILMAVPQFQPALQVVVTPLNDCLCRQTMAALGDVLKANAQKKEYTDDIHCTITDAELIMLLNALERLILLSLAYTSEQDASDDELPVAEKPGSETSGLLGYVSNVFGSDASSSNPMEHLASRFPGYRSLDEGIRVLFSVWASLIWKPSLPGLPMNETLSLIYTRTRLRCRRVLEHLFRVQSTEVFESVVHWWSRDATLSSSSPDAAFELVDVLVANAQNSVQMICESIGNRILSSPDKGKKQTLNPNLTEAILFKFLEEYFSRLESPLAVQVWSRYIQLVKEVLTSSKDFKTPNFYALRCLGVLAEKITQTTAMEDRKIRKELQDCYGKLLESCIVYVGRFTDQGSWIRRSAKESIINSGRESPALRHESIGRTDEKSASNGASAFSEAPKLGSIEVVGQINSFVATSALPNLRKLLIENDKIITACNNIVYYIVNPAMRGKTRPMDVDAIVIQILQEMSRIPAALKSWRTPVIDLLGDNRLFNCNPSDAFQWRPIIKILYDTDKSALPELLGKLANAPSANIFTNREYEMLLRSLNLRRLSFVVFSGEKNGFLTQVPTIQEKLVDIFRSVPSPIVQSEVFLCIRVLLCRLSPHNLTSFWPVVLTELYRIFEQAMMYMPPDGSEELQLVLSACKCLDTLLVLQTEEFQIHQWIFITDTVDAVYRPDDWLPEAMMDQLAEIAANIPAGETSGSKQIETLSSQPEQRLMRRPLLSSLRQIESMRDLVPFLSNVSVSSYESVYASGGNIDWEAVEQSIMYDMFDGR